MSHAACHVGMHAAHVLQLGEADRAEAELLGLAAHDEASVAACMDGFRQLLGSQTARLEALQSTADLLLERFPGDASVPLLLVQLVYGQEQVRACWGYGMGCRTVW